MKSNINNRLKTDRQKSKASRQPKSLQFERLDERIVFSLAPLMSVVELLPAPSQDQNYEHLKQAAFGEDGEIVRWTLSNFSALGSVKVFGDETGRNITPASGGYTQLGWGEIDLLPSGKPIGEVYFNDGRAIATWSDNSVPTKVVFEVPGATRVSLVSQGIANTPDGTLYALVQAIFPAPRPSALFWVNTKGTAVEATDIGQTNPGLIKLLGVSDSGKLLVGIVANGSSYSELRLYAEDLLSFQSIKAASAEIEKVYDAAISPDGKLISFIAANKKQKTAIYAKLVDSNSNSVKRIIGEPGDGELDPTENWMEWDQISNGLPLTPGLPNDWDWAAFGDYYGTHTYIQRESIRVTSLEENSGRKVAKIFYTAAGFADQTSLFALEIEVDDGQPGDKQFQVSSPSLILEANQQEVEISQNTKKKVTAVRMADVNRDGELLVQLRLEDYSVALARLELVRRPVLIVPGIVGSFVENDLIGWIEHVGADPNTLSIDPLAFVYDPLYQTLIDSGYTLNENLYLATYDWRLPPAPLDGNNDGVVSSINVDQAIVHQRFGVDYLIYWINKAMVDWKAKHPKSPLDSVDIIAHSTGGLIVRSYAQSTIYGSKTSTSGEWNLPKINNFVMAGVPQEGAPKALSFLYDNWLVDPNSPVYRLFLRSIANTAFQKLLQGRYLTFPTQFGAELFGLSNLLAMANMTLEQFKLGMASRQYSPAIAGVKQLFIDKYVSQIRGLVGTYDFVQSGNAWSNVNSFSQGQFANYFLNDLNAAPDWNRSNGKTLYNFPVFAHGNGVDTIVALETGVGTEARDTTLQSLNEFPSDADPGQPYLEQLESDCTQAPPTTMKPDELRKIRQPFACGDGTVPRISLISKLANDLRFKHQEFLSSSTNVPSPPKRIDVVDGEVDHIEMLSNPAIVRKLLANIGVPILKNEDVAGKPLFGGISSGLSVIGSEIVMAVDPVGAVLIDRQGRRTGFSDSTIIEQIPNSYYLGDENGLLVAIDPTGQESWQIELTGLGGPYYVDLSGRLAGQNVSFRFDGQLDVGQKINYDLPKLTADMMPVAAGESVSVAIGSSVEVPLLDNDWISPDAQQGLSIEILSAPQQNTVVVNQGAGSVLLQAASVGTDQLYYRIIDGQGRVSAPAKLSISVQPQAGQRPIATRDFAVVTSDSPIRNLPILANDADSTGSSQFLVPQLVQGDPTVFSITAEQNLLFQATASLAGFQRASYVVQDQAGLKSDPALVEIFVVDYSLNRPWNNSTLSFDTNGDGLVTPSDALRIINYLNSNQDRVLPDSGPSSVFGYLDVSADDRISPQDALLIINQLNSRAGAGEGVNVSVKSFENRQLAHDAFWVNWQASMDYDLFQPQRRLRR